VKLTIEPTDKIIEIVTANGDTVPGRVWQGRTAFGVDVALVVTRLAADKEEDLTEFEATLTPQAPGRVAREAFPMRMVL
jgi:hypothetical protein